MLKKAAPWIVLAAGAVGAALRRIQLGLPDEATGFFPRSAPVSVALAVLSLLAAVLIILFCATRPASRASGCEQVFAMSTAEYILYFVCGGVLGAQGVYVFLNRSGATDVIFGILACVSGAAVILFTLAMKNGQKQDGLATICAVPPVFGCFWLAALYKGYSAEPQILLFCYEALAIAAAAVSAYYAEGYVCARPRPRTAAAASLIAVYFAAVALAGLSFPYTVVMAAAGVLSFLNARKILASLGAQRR